MNYADELVLEYEIVEVVDAGEVTSFPVSGHHIPTISKAVSMCLRQLACG